MDTLTVILDEMKKKKISQKELCQKLGIHPQAFTNWKNGTTDSYLKKLPQISEILGVSLDYLLGNTADPNLPARKSYSDDIDTLSDSEVRQRFKQIVDETPDDELETLLYMLEAAIAADKKRKQGNNK